MKRQTVARVSTRGRPNRRGQIVAAAERLVRSQGLSSVTTRRIAEEVGCSEGALYVHFKGRLQLLVAVLEESLPDMLVPLQALDGAAGKSTPQRNLQKALRGIFSFHQRVTPMLASLFAEPELLMAYRESLVSRRKGPHGAIARLRQYIQSEQGLGRIDEGIDPEMTATILMASSFFYAFTGQFFGTPERFGAFCKRLIAGAIPTSTRTRKAAAGSEGVRG